MKKDIFRNIAIVTIIFMVVLSVMLVTNYFQVRGVTPLQMEVTETLRTLNEGNEENPELQEQIRQLDLLARKAYFVQKGHLKAGIYILLGMAAILAVCLRFYYEGVKSIPEKEIDVIDDWWVKSKSRKYMGWGVAGLALTALLFAFLSSPFYGSQQGKEQQEEMAQAAKNVYDVLISKYGIPASRLVLDSKGGVDYLYKDDAQVSRSVLISEVK